jgi:glucan phosphoethanolaminetransferase (alkaline phosphatase superfamily)
MIFLTITGSLVSRLENAAGSLRWAESCVPGGLCSNALMLVCRYTNQRNSQMPMRAYRASAAYAGGHLSANMWLWIIIFAALTVVFGALYWISPDLMILAHLLTLSCMVCGILVMLQSQVGYVSPYAPKEEEDKEVEVVTPPIPRA